MPEHTPNVQEERGWVVFGLWNVDARQKAGLRLDT
jgi:hypothetical protein